MKNIEFISYIGFPCNGLLKLKIDGKEEEFNNAFFFSEPLPKVYQEIHWCLFVYKENNRYKLGNNQNIVFTNDEINHIFNLVNSNIDCHHCGACF